MPQSLTRVTLTVALVAAVVASLPAQSAGSGEPELVGAGVVSTSNLNETFPAIDPRDGALWFSRYERSFNGQTIYVARAEGDGWAAPVVAPFSGTHGDRAPRFSPDGARLFFTSNRPVPGRAQDGDFNIWVATRRGPGWSEPELVPAPVSVPDGPDIHSAATADEAIYVASRRPGGRGRSDIYRIPRQGPGWGPAEHLGATVNDSLSQPDLWVSADGSWMILVITDRPGGLGGDDLYLVRRGAEGWSAPVHLPAPINSAEYEYGPSVSPDGRYLYFTSHRGGSGDIYRVPALSLRVY